MSDDIARTRYLIMSLTRLVGVGLVITGLLVTQGAIGWPAEVGYVLLVIGILDVFLLPQLMARRWRSPKE